MADTPHATCKAPLPAKGAVAWGISVARTGGVVAVTDEGPVVGDDAAACVGDGVGDGSKHTSNVLRLLSNSA